jgi:ubiquinone/menaquinone biosynthesis C-methylase UbiE
MEMTGFEKYFVNREAKVRRNVGAVRQRLSKLEVDHIHDALEIGCGIGGVSAFLAEEYGMNVFGTDYDPKQVAAAKARHSQTKNLHYQTEDVSRLSFPDRSFDLVLAQDTFHHVAAWDSAAREIARVLRPGGYLIWMEFAYSKAVKRMFQPFVKQYGLYTWSDILQIFAETGMKMEHLEQLRHGPFAYRHIVWRKGDRESS